MICHYWYFKNLEFKFDLNICNKCSIRCIFSKSKRIEILNVKGVHYRCILCDISRNKVVNILNNSGLEDKGVIILNNPVSEDRNFLYMDFGANKTPIEVTKEGEFGGTYFKDIYSGVNGKWYKKSWKEFDQLKNIDQKYYCSSYYDCGVNKYGVKCGTSLRFWENKAWINEIDPYEWFQWYFRYWLGRRSKDDERKIIRQKRIARRFSGKLVKMLKDLVVNLMIIQFRLKLDKFY